jgi:hypothetical protein
MEDPDINSQSYPPNVRQSGQKRTMEKRQSLQQMLLGKPDICLKKTKSRAKFVTLYMYQLKVN